MDLENTIIDYFSSNDLKLGQVLKQNSDKLQVEDANRKVERVRERQVVIVHGRSGSDLAGYATRLAARAEEVDTELLWESVHEIREDLSLSRMADEYFGESDSVSQAGILRAVLMDGIRFKRKGLTFMARDPEDVEKQLVARQREAEKAALREAALAWLQTVFSSKGPLEVPEALAVFMGQVEAYMFQGHLNDAAKLLEEAHRRRSAREIGLELLDRSGRLPADADEFLLMNDIRFGFSEAVLEQAGTATAFTPGSDRVDFRGLETVAIDDPGTREVDDAFTMEVVSDTLVVGIHIADPGHFVHKGDLLDRAAADRPLTLYLPTVTVTMLPEHIGCDLASLNAGEDRPSLSFRVVFDAAGQILESTFSRGQVRVTRHLTYEEADDLLAAPDTELAENLRRLQVAADAQRQLRMEKGAFLLTRPELKVSVRDGEPTVKHYSQNTPSRMVVSEMMILANRLAADYAWSHGVPIIYRTQDPPPQPLPEMQAYDPHIFDQSVRLLKRSRLSTEPLPHAGLGLDVYAQVSSPIRRYTDMVMQRQLAAHLAGEPYPYEATEIVEVLGTADQVEFQNRRLEREATRYWIMTYIERHCIGQHFDGVAVDDGKGGILVEIQPYTTRGRLMGATGGQYKPGDRLGVTLREVNAERGQMLLEPDPQTAAAE